MPADDRYRLDHLDRLLGQVRRHGKRRLLLRRLGAIATGAAVVAAAFGLPMYLQGPSQTRVRVTGPASAGRSARNGLVPLAPALSLPHLSARQSCPTTTGTRVHTAAFDGVAYANGPVRLLVGNQTDPSTGRVDLGLTGTPGLLAVETIWYATPGYDGGFVVQGFNLRTGVAIPISDASDPVPGPLEVPAGPTINTTGGYRTIPGATWVTAPGCYGWQIDGPGFHSTVVLDLLAGWLHGQIRAVGGPAGAASAALQGTVRGWRGPRQGPPVFTLPAAPGGFTILLPPGRYTLIATSPRYQNGRSPCVAPPATISDYRKTDLTLTCNRR